MLTLIFIGQNALEKIKKKNYFTLSFKWISKFMRSDSKFLTCNIVDLNRKQLWLLLWAIPIFATFIIDFFFKILNPIHLLPIWKTFSLNLWTTCISLISPILKWDSNNWEFNRNINKVWQKIVQFKNQTRNFLKKKNCHLKYIIHLNLIA